ncbi:MAG: hypothetical protein AB1633_09125 [Elusimicrobiota bacterium]
MGFVSGLIGSIAKNLSNFLIYRAGGTEMLYGHLAASLYSKPLETKKAKNFWLGQVLDVAIGTTFGVPVVYLMKKTGNDHHLLKGASVGLLLWGTLYSIGSLKTNLFSAKPTLTKTHYSALWNNTLYGITTAYAANKLADPGLFPEKDGEHKNTKV